MQLIFKKFNDELGEIPQSIPLRFAFATVEGDTVKNDMPFVMCRDFLGDVVYTNKTGTVMNIYGFSSENVKIQGNGNLLLKFTARVLKCYDTFVANFPFINFIEYSNNLPLSTLEQVERKGKEKYLLVRINSPYWTQTIFGISLFSFLIKVCLYRDNGEGLLVSAKKASLTEANYLENIDIINKMLYNLNSCIVNVNNATGYNNEVMLYDYHIHNACGFYSLSRVKIDNNVISNNIFGL